ncbi:MAG: Tex family protein [Pseudomonadota bacterium]
MNITHKIAEELAVAPQQIAAAIELLDSGATVPFIARYRKEVTGGLDDTHLRTLAERLIYLRELEDRRKTVLASIDEQGKLTPELKASILEADTKTRLEDLYRPHMPKRRTKAQIAREAGLDPLAQGLFSDPSQVPEALAAGYLNPDQGVTDVKAALEGARHILMEQFAEDSELVGQLREFLWENVALRSKVVEGKEQEGIKFSDYFDASEPIKNIPSHRALALMRGWREGILQLELELEGDAERVAARKPTLGEQKIAHYFSIADRGRPADAWLLETVRWTWRVKVFTHLELELKNRLREAAEAEAIRVFAKNLHDLLMAAPAGAKATLGLDPGLRTGVKVALVDATGKLLETITIYPHAPKNQWDQSIAVLAVLAKKHGISLISIGNGTASRETDKLAGDLIKRHPELCLTKIVVSEAGASVYSASELAAAEFPELDVSLRGAVSIARRLQDPLAELVKIDPKSIGVGQYQHDVNQTQLARTLDGVVEDCVNSVGVDVNSASVPLLNRVAGLNKTLAANIVSYRDTHGAFADRKQLMQVPRLGEKAFEQCAGFLRIVNGKNPLDSSAVHPEAYSVVKKILDKTGKSVKELMGDSRLLRSLNPKDFTDEKFGEPTVRDIIAELEKPGRDPRPEFVTATFRDGVESLNDLEPGMMLEGVVTNVTNFGAFVDIGVHQDGLVHISALSDQFVKDPHQVVKTGQVVKVKVIEVDKPRKRISLSMRMQDEAQAAAKPEPRAASGKKPLPKGKPQPESQTAMAAAFAKLKR